MLKCTTNRTLDWIATHSAYHFYSIEYAAHEGRTVNNKYRDYCDDKFIIWIAFGVGGENTNFVVPKQQNAS